MSTSEIRRCPTMPPESSEQIKHKVHDSMVAKSLAHFNQEKGASRTGRKWARDVEHKIKFLQRPR